MIVALGGVPATGKTTIARNLMAQLGPKKDFSYGKLHGHFFAQANVLVFGLYGSEETFQGTDKLSMAVQPDAITFLREKSKLFPKANIFFEGDRLFTGTFLAACSRTDELRVFVLEVAGAALNRRYELRGGSQAEQFLRGRTTKLLNIMNALPGVLQRKNDLRQQSDATVEEILALLVLRKGS